MQIFNILIIFCLKNKIISLVLYGFKSTSKIKINFDYLIS